MELAPVTSSTNAGENGVSQFVKFIFLKVLDNITNITVFLCKML